MSQQPTNDLPVVALREAVVFPNAVVPFTTERPRTIRALRDLRPHDRIVLVAQRDPEQPDPAFADVFSIGTIAEIAAVIQQTDSATSVVAMGLERVRLVEELAREPFLRARVEPLPDEPLPEPDAEFSALVESVRELMVTIVATSVFLSNDLIPLVHHAESPSTLANIVAGALPSLSRTKRQELLETTNVRQRLVTLHAELVRQVENVRIQQRLRDEVEKKIDRSQREFFLREELKAIHKELGDADDAERIAEELEARVNAAEMPEPARVEAMRELRRLAHIPVVSAEHSVVRTYLEWLVSLPWSRTTAREVDVEAAQRVLDEDHYDLEKVKERVVEHLAVLKLRRELKGPLLCLVGPPGVGKTSVGKSIARASGRAFVRISLGGVRDEAEIRGHRRTYVGALPGQIVQGIRRAGTRDPVFMLDEIDKLGADFRGDPGAALMEVLDPEQNSAFRDHYLDVPFDLSRVLFITTANVLDTVPRALVDRMEMLELPGYSEPEKLEIARRYLVPRQAIEHGLALDAHIAFEDDGLREVIRHYTREAGVRSLERQIAAILRKHARGVASGKWSRLVVGPDAVRARLGVERFQVETEVADRTRTPGVAVALAWTPDGGDVLFVEAASTRRDRGEFILTGHLGEVMQESAKAALSWTRAHAKQCGIPPDAFRQADLHLHVPSGAVPKDGPSAGLAMVAALVSLFTGRPVKPSLALSGEITLSGRVLGVGGIKEKVLAARRSGVREIVLPAANEALVQEELAAELREGVQFRFVSTVEQMLPHAFEQCLEAAAAAALPAQA
jgi:ATP-dependent Lon protease